MKKILLAITVLFCAGSVSAQNLHILDMANGNAMVNGQTMTYTTSSLLTDARHFEIHNAQGQQVTVKVRKTVLALNAPTSSTWFCSDLNCYAPGTTLSPNINIGGNGAFELSIDYDAEDYSSGLTRVRYAIFNTANPTDSAYIIVEYNTPVGIATNNALKATVSNPMPNPASSSFSMNYKMTNTPASAKLVVFNMLGAQVMETEITDMEGTVRMDVSTLEQGIYFCSLVADNKTLTTRRLVVSH
jgi:hypothetical protein